MQEYDKDNIPDKVISVRTPAKNIPCQNCKAHLGSHTPLFRSGEGAKVFGILTHGPTGDATVGTGNNATLP